MNIKCNICGGDVAVSADKTFATCEYCGSTVTVPRVSDEQRAAAFNRGSHFRRIGEFDKALASYERILREDDTDAEAHWCAALCRFGIEYVEDPATYEWIPTCHRASFDSFLEDVDFKAALEHSDGLTRRLYQKEAAKIAEVQRGILATSQNEEPYDVFLCYKETGEDGQRTRDSILAQDIYYQLTDQGHRVFFSRITLEDKAGSQYEPYIFAALNSAKVMVAVGTKPEHFSAVWVKNEWSRFLALMRRDRSRVLLPCYRDMDPYDLPEQLAVLQSYDMGKIGFIQDLIRGVDKVVKAGKTEAAPVVQAAATAPAAVPVQNHDSAVIMGFLDYEMGKKDSAISTFRQVLMQNDTCAEAYLGLMLASNESDREAYRAKYQMYTSKQLSALEKKIFNQQTQDALLLQYIEMHMEEKLLEAILLYTGVPKINTFALAIQAWPTSDIIRAFLQRGCDVNSKLPASSSGGIGDAPLLSYFVNRSIPHSTSPVTSYKCPVCGYIHSGSSIPIDFHCPLCRVPGSKFLKTSTTSVKAPSSIEQSDSAAILLLLLENGADPNEARSQNGSFFTPLYDCLMLKDYSSMRMLLEHGANVNCDCPKQVEYDNHITVTLLGLAAKNDDCEAAAVLLEYGASVNATVQVHNRTHSEEFPPLYYAIQNHSEKMAQLLLEHGAHPNGIIRNSRSTAKEESPLLLSAVVQHDTKMVHLLIKHGADTNGVSVRTESTAESKTPILLSAITNQSEEVAQILLKHGANPNCAQTTTTNYILDTRTPLNCIIDQTNDTTMLRMLLENGADPELCSIYHTPDIHLETPPIVKAVLMQRLEAIQTLLNYGATADAVRIQKREDEETRMTPLSVCICEEPNYKIAELLLQSGCNPNSMRTDISSTCEMQTTLLADAICKTREPMFVQLLLKYGANPKIPKSMHFKGCHKMVESMLHCAVFYAQSIPIMDILLANGSDLSDVTTHNDKDIPFRKYPYDNEIHGDIRLHIVKKGWKGPSLFEHFRSK